MSGLKDMWTYGTTHATMCSLPRALTNLYGWKAAELAACRKGPQADPRARDLLGKKSVNSGKSEGAGEMA